MASKSGKRRHAARWWLIGAWICLAAAAAWAAGPESDQHVHITADRLLADMDGRTAEFIGNVRAVQGTTVITAARLKVFYIPGSAAAGSEAAGQEAIERIEASGEVNIQMEDRNAQADDAVYTAADGILVLTGKQARLTSGANTVVGGRITLDRNTNRITVEKASDGRVEAVFKSDDKVLQ